MQDTFQLHLETLPQSPPLEPSPEDVDAYYQSFCPQGGPPLEDIREHVVSALRSAKRPPQANDSLSEGAAALDLHLLVTQAADLALVVKETSVATFVSSHPAKWFDAQTGAHLLEALIEQIDKGAVGPRKRQLFAPDDVRRSLRSTLEDTAALLGTAAQNGRRFRLTPSKQGVPLKEQLEVLASAGIRLREGCSPKALVYNYTETELSQECFSAILADLNECSDDIAELTLKCVESEDDRHIYTLLAESIRALCKGKLPLEDIESHVDFDQQKAHVSFTLNGQREVMDLDVSGAWADMRFYESLSKHLSSRSGKSLHILAPDKCGDAAAFVCLSRDERLRLEAAGIPLEAL